MRPTRGPRIGSALLALGLLGCQSPPPWRASPAAVDDTRCRDFSITTTVGGQPERTVGRACQQADGSWRMLPETNPKP